MNAMRHTSFKAIADPTRREIIALLVDAREPLPITSITERFDTTRQAVTKHIKILHSAGLIEIRKQGRERFCTINADPLREIHEWVASYKYMWHDEESDIHGLHPGGKNGDADKHDDIGSRRLSLYRAVSAM